MICIENVLYIVKVNVIGGCDGQVYSDDDCLNLKFLFLGSNGCGMNFE